MGKSLERAEMATDNEKQQLACVYASLILADDGLEVTNDKLTQLMSAAKISVNPFWPSLFSDALKNRDITEIAFTGLGGGGGGGGAEAAAGGDAPAQEEVKVEENPAEPSSEEEMELDL